MRVTHFTRGPPGSPSGSELATASEKFTKVPKELPPELLRLVTKLDDSDWLFSSVGCQNDVDLLFG
jgi:hypothetical protein